MTRIKAGAVCALMLPMVASAQVGHTPKGSPYHDLEYRQELSWFGGEYRAAAEPAGVATRNGAMAGVHYELHMAGPAFFAVNVANVFSRRRVIDPAQPLALRELGTTPVSLLLGDIGFALNLTGYKSWHALVPTFGAGLGLASAFDLPDVGRFRVGSPFLLAFRPGIKLASRGKWQGRIDASNFVYRIRYPETYFLKTGADDAVFPPNAKRTVWRRNVGWTLGLTYAFGR